MGFVETNHFHKGLKIEYEGGIWEIIEYRHSKMAQRSAVMKTKIKNIVTGAVQEKNFRSGDAFKVPDMDRKNMQFLYKDDIGFHFMDLETYDQNALSKEQIGDELIGILRKDAWTASSEYRQLINDLSDLIISRIPRIKFIALSAD